ncbi:hypothetical protein [Herbiconiux daphne]|uniref:Uncharacterized protein n=1 Tax=Herbiconiux daphne TaxID=2970914 RepID=A0ABT2HBZ7_9MICO|nr:hypothetical protein [Herbiconiux daphne]MCS5737382.1 hypothetical protein [Herbiconiux daphne]
MQKEQLKLRGFLYITDVCPRFEEDDLDAYRIQRRFGEKLLEKIPLYSKEKDG